VKIYQVEKTLVSTNRISELKNLPLLVVKEKNGSRSVAVDAVGCVPGDWVIAVSGSGSRAATGDKEYPTDLTIVGIIDHWEE
jgi:ethanolamine utilization protein EutN